jgi:multimeric flavodoxin WrbA
MKAIIFLGSLKQKQSDSNSAYIAKLVEKQLLERGFKEVELFNLRKIQYEPGVSNVTESGNADGMTQALAKVLGADCVIFSTPIWWGIHSSLIQALMERMCYYDDFAIKTAINPLYGKTFGAIISGSDDGFQQITGLLLNFATNMGFTVPPDAIVPCVMQDRKDIRTDQRTQQHIELFARNQAAWTQLLRRRKIGAEVQENKEPRPDYMSWQPHVSAAKSEPIEPEPVETEPLDEINEPVTMPVIKNHDYMREQGL